MCPIKLIMRLGCRDWTTCFCFRVFYFRNGRSAPFVIDTIAQEKFKRRYQIVIKQRNFSSKWTVKKLCV